MSQKMTDKTFHHLSSHSGHVAYVILLFLIGFLVGYGVGKVYEAERGAGIAFDQVVTRLVTKKPAVTTSDSKDQSEAAVQLKSYTDTSGTKVTVAVPSSYNVEFIPKSTPLSDGTIRLLPGPQISITNTTLEEPNGITITRFDDGKIKTATEDIAEEKQSDQLYRNNYGVKRDPLVITQHDIMVNGVQGYWLRYDNHAFTYPSGDIVRVQISGTDYLVIFSWHHDKSFEQILKTIVWEK